MRRWWRNNVNLSDRSFLKFLVIFRRKFRSGKKSRAASAAPLRLFSSNVLSARYLLHFATEKQPHAAIRIRQNNKAA
jgi:hypothetical protein